MNTNGFEFDEKTAALLERLDRGGRLPHAVIIESQSEDTAAEIAVLLSMYSVCTSDGERPCGECKNCRNAKSKAHADISYAKPDKKHKSDSYSIEQVREWITDAQIKPNDADAKVYVFERADVRMSPIVQNAFLKLLEEPPRNVSFLLLCERSQRFLPTVLSRCTMIRAGGGRAIGETAAQTAAQIAEGIIAATEYPLLKSLYALKDKELAAETLAALEGILRDALVTLCGGEPTGEKELAGRLAARLTRAKLIKMIELCGSCEDNIRQNCNINLLCTQMCGELRRITWQR